MGKEIDNDDDRPRRTRTGAIEVPSRMSGPNDPPASPPAPKVQVASSPELIAYLREQNAKLGRVVELLERQNQALVLNVGSAFATGPLAPGANQQVILEWPNGDCAPFLDCVTIDVDFDQPAETSETTYAGAFLSAYWGDCSHRVDFDLMRGTSVTLAGRKVLLKGSYPNAAAVQPTINLRASIGRGSKAPSGVAGNARRTLVIGVVPQGAETARFEIPAWTSAFNWYNNDVANTQIELRQYATQTSVAVLSAVNIGKITLDTTPRVSDANWVTLFNPAGVPIPAARIFCYIGR